MIKFIVATYRDGRLVPETPLDWQEGQKVYLAASIDPQELHSVDRYSAEWEWDPDAAKKGLQRLTELDNLPTMSDDEYEKWQSEREEGCSKRTCKESAKVRRATNS